eukprot:EG_transcript_4389
MPCPCARRGGAAPGAGVPGFAWVNAAAYEDALGPALALQRRGEADLWPMDGEVPGKALPPRPPLALRAAAAAAPRPILLPLHDPHENFARLARPGLPRLGAPLLAALVHTPWATLVRRAAARLQEGPAVATSLDPILAYPLLFRGDTVAPPGYLEYLRPADVRRAVQQLTKALGSAEYPVGELETHLLQSLGLADGVRGVYISPRSPIYDLVLHSSQSTQSNGNQLAAAIQQAQNGKGPSRVVSEAWDAARGGTALCPDCFRALAMQDLTLLFHPVSRGQMGLRGCGRCLRNQTALLQGREPPDVGFLMPQFAGTLTHHPPRPPGLAGTKMEDTPADGTPVLGASPDALDELWRIWRLQSHFIHLPGATLVRRALSYEACVRDEVTKAGDDSPLTYQVAAGKCVAVITAEGLAEEARNLIALPFTALAIVADAAAVAGWFDPQFTEINVSGQSYLWETSGTVFGTFLNISTAFRILTDETWSQVLKPSVLFAGDVLVAAPGAIAGAAAATRHAVAVAADDVGAAAQVVGSGLQVATATTGEAVVEAGKVVGTGVVTAAQATGAALGSAAGVVGQGLSDAASAAAGAATQAGQTVVGGAEAAGHAIEGAAEATGSAIVGAGQAVGNAASSAANSVASTASRCVVQ